MSGAYINTTCGKMLESMMEKRTGIVDDEREHTEWIEYWYYGECVHRSAHVTLKQAPTMFGEAQEIGG